MNKSLPYYEEMLSDFIDNKLPASKLEELFEFIQSDPDAYHRLFESFRIQAQLESLSGDERIVVHETVSSRMKERLMNNIQQAGREINIPIQQGIHRIHFLRRSWMRFAAAAVFVLVIAGTWWLTERKPGEPSQEQRLANHIKPGVTGSTLILSDGRTIVLDTAGNGMVAAGFTKGTQALAVSASEVAYATVTTPNGHIQRVDLADGTVVWLNAGSSFTFPTSFNGSSREVSMTGEVYFEVAKDASKHFFVQTSTERIEVKGTHFNVNAYGKNPATTLLEGLVQIGQTTLTPGNQYIGGSVKEADTEEVMAWKNGMFRFSGANIQEIMTEVKRWYNVEVEYEGDVSKLDFNAAIPRNTNVAELLKILELTKSVEFRIENNRIHVKQL